MQHRIKTFAIIVQDHKLLLVMHREPGRAEEFWVLPGGGMESKDEDLMACAKREAFEETGLAVTPGRLVYFDEFYDRQRDTLHVQLYILADNFSGAITLDHTIKEGPLNEHIYDLRWLSQTELQTLTVFPEELKSMFWDDLAQGFKQIRYFGRRSN